MAQKGYPREMPDMTPQQRRDNWWRYHWLHVLCIVLAVITLVGIAWERFTSVEADCSVALVTRYAAAPDEIASLQAALEKAASDTNGDGEVHVAINAIQIDYKSTDLDDGAIQVMRTNVDKLNADFYMNQSGIFLLDDPESFQTNHEALRYLDGSEPPEGASDWVNMTIPWKDWSGGAEVQFSHCDPDHLWFARRIAGTEENAFAGSDALWDALWKTD